MTEHAMAIAEAREYSLADGYGMRLGDADAERRKPLGRFYDPNSVAFIESAGVAAGDSIADVGCSFTASLVGSR